MVNYCSAICQQLDWTLHQYVCNDFDYDERNFEFNNVFKASDDNSTNSFWFESGLIDDAESRVLEIK